MAAEFDHPWKTPETAMVIDAYCENEIDWKLLATEPRVVGVIHKATTGARKVDPKYRSRRLEAKQLGYLWGSYHLGLAGHPERQADYYIKTVQPEPNELIALDLESLKSKKFMNASEAIRFIKRVKQRLGRYPVVYANFRDTAIITEKFRNTEFANTPLWYANFKDSIRNFPTDLWPSYALWQFSCEILNQYAIPGTKPDIDVNVFNGSVEDLKAKWPLTRRSPQSTHPSCE